MTNETRNNPGSQSGRSFIEEARREQIVKHAIEVLAEYGFQSASLARIAEHAGISKGVISYHFKGKDDLLYQIVSDYGQTSHEYIWSRVEETSTSTEALARYIEASINFGVEYRQHLMAVLEIFFNFRNKDGELVFDLSSEKFLEYEVKPLDDLFRKGQQSREFRQFDTHIMAVSLRGAIDNIEWHRLAHHEDCIDRYVREMTELFIRATIKNAKKLTLNESESCSEG